MHDLEAFGLVGGVRRHGLGEQGRQLLVELDLEHHVVAGDARLADDPAHGVGVDHEVLAALLGGAQVEPIGQLTHFRRPEKPRTGGRCHADEASAHMGRPSDEAQPGHEP
jgi:hypothetical protein